MTAPGDVWEHSDTNPSGDQEWENFLMTSATNPVADVSELPIPMGDYDLLIEGMDGHNTFFLSFGVPASADVPDPDCELCQGDVTELTLQFRGDDLPAQDNGDPGFVMVVTNQGDVVSEGSQLEFVVPGQGFPSLAGSTSIDVFLNGELNTRIPTVCDGVSCGDDDDDDDDDDGPDICFLEPIAQGSVFGDFEVVGGKSSRTTQPDAPFCPGTPCPPGDDDDDDDDSDSDSDSGSASAYAGHYYCSPDSDTKLQSIVLEYTGEKCGSTNNTQSGKVKCKDKVRGSLPNQVQISAAGGEMSTSMVRVFSKEMKSL